MTTKGPTLHWVRQDTKPLILELDNEPRPHLTNSAGLKLVNESAPKPNDKMEGNRQPAKITMNIPSFLLHKTSPSPQRLQHPEVKPKLVDVPSTEFQRITGISNPSSAPSDNIVVPIQMKLDPGVLESFRTGMRSPSFDRPQVDPSDMINRIISQPPALPKPNTDGNVNEYPVSWLNLENSLYDMKTVVRSEMTTNSTSHSPGSSTGAEQPLSIRLEQSVPNPTSLALPMEISVSSLVVPQIPMNVNSSNEAINSKVVLPTTIVTSNIASMQMTPPMTEDKKLSIVANNEKSNDLIKSTRMAEPFLKNSKSPLPPQNISTALSNNSKLSSSDLPPDKISKLRGPKCYRQSEIIRPGVVCLGSYQRPKRPISLRHKDIRREDIAMLVMPSEDWSCNVYPAPNCKQEKSIYVISETLLNSDLVEIVRKSISIQPNWGMKFSVLATDMSRFNLGLDATDITDIQAILDNFDAFPVCSGIDHQVTTGTKSTANTSSILYADRKYRNIECPLLLVNFSDKKCSSCLKLLNIHVKR